MQDCSKMVLDTWFVSGAFYALFAFLGWCAHILWTEWRKRKKK